MFPLDLFTIMKTLPDNKSILLSSFKLFCNYTNLLITAIPQYNIKADYPSNINNVKTKRTHRQTRLNFYETVGNTLAAWCRVATTVNVTLELRQTEAFLK